ncbi:MAG: hypothetical protein R3344_11325, partial [Acidobacteriota bacterium]|nr:hypothetical protein [Acidobacteriota bacterium]
MLDVRNLLEELKADWIAGELSEADERSTKSSFTKWIASAAVVAALGTVVVYVARRPAPSVPRFGNPKQITRDAGVEDFPTWSPDGDLLAYASSGDIWVAHVGGGPPVNRTGEHGGWDRFPTWSPDGRLIAFVSERGGGSLLVMPVLAGPPNRVAAVSNVRPQWSPDGNELAYLIDVVENEHPVIEIVSLNAATTRRIELTDAPAVAEPEGGHDLSWSPDGRFFVFMDGAHNYQATGLWMVRVSDAEVFRLTDGLTRDHSPSWSPDAHVVYYVSNRGGSQDLWQQRLRSDGRPRGEPERMTAGLGIREAVISRDGTRLAYSKGGLVSNVWRVPILLGRPATWADAEQITSDETYIQFIDISPDGERLAVSSDRSGNSDIWILPARGGDMVQITNDPTPDWAPSWSPDGKQIAFYAFRSGNRDVWVVPSVGGRATQLTTHTARDWFPSWSPDGREIVFDSSRDGGSGLWVVPAEGGVPRQLTDDGNYPDWSPDGQWIAFGTFGENRQIWRVPATGGPAESLVSEFLVTDPS